MGLSVFFEVLRETGKHNQPSLCVSPLLPIFQKFSTLTIETSPQERGRGQTHSPNFSLSHWEVQRTFLNIPE